MLRVLGDAYTLQLSTALHLHPTFYVGRLRRYRPATIPSDADTASVHPAAVRRTAPPDGGARDCPVPAVRSCESSDRDAARSQRPPSDHAPPLRDGPAPLVDSVVNVRHIVEGILRYDDHRARPARPQANRHHLGRGALHRDGCIPEHRQYLVRWLGPMIDSWEPRFTLQQDIPDVVAVYEATRAASRA
ncbi:hypothetical protein PI125_g16779 [Phytophthora idaei]|nr:hypothetical protein PI125_g16779 [Phytophthora idaei]